MKLIRLTSVFLCCALLSSFLILPASAVDDDDYYSALAVSDGSALVAPASLAGIALTAGSEYSSQLSTIITSLQTQTNYLSMIYSYMTGLADWRNSLLQNTARIKDYSSILSTISSGVSSISGKVATESTLSAISDKVATETTLSNISKYFKDGYVAWYPLDENGIPDINSEYGFSEGSFGQFMSTYMFNMTVDGYIKNQGYTVFHYLKNLSDVLAPEDDKKLSQVQKENREQVENDFLNGSSGKTSLGKDDFGSLSSVGGTFKDTISLNGQSSLSDLTSGLADADTAGQGWFSQATKDSLDSVSGSGSSESTVSTFSDDGLSSVDVDPDPYHMQGFEYNYAWLWGDD